MGGMCGACPIPPKSPENPHRESAISEPPVLSLSHSDVPVKDRQSVGHKPATRNHASSTAHLQEAQHTSSMSGSPVRSVSRIYLGDATIQLLSTSGSSGRGCQAPHQQVSYLEGLDLDHSASALPTGRAQMLPQQASLTANGGKS